MNRRSPSAKSASASAITRGNTPLRLVIADSESHLVGGVDTVRRNLVAALSRHPQVEKLIWLVPDHRLESYRSLLPPDARVQMASFLWPPRSAPRWLHAAARRLSRMRKLASATRRLSHWLDDRRAESLRRQHKATHVLHMAVLTQPPPLNPKGTVGIVYDIKTTAFHGCDVLANFALWLRDVEKIVTISEFTRQQLIELAPERAGHIEAILLGTTPQPRSASHQKASVHRRSVPPVDGATGGVFYYPATLNAHKDHLSLLRAAVTLARWGERVTIVLTGGRTHELLGDEPLGAEPLEQARRFYQENRVLLRGRVQVLGSCPWEVVEEQYKSCHCVVLPTLYEGFGLPFAEALERGVPIICSDIDAFKEQIERYGCSEPAVRTFGQGDADALAERMREFLHDQPRSELAASQLQQQAASWTWDHVADSYVRVLHSVAPPR